MRGESCAAAATMTMLAASAATNHRTRANEVNTHSGGRKNYGRKKAKKTQKQRRIKSDPSL
jgi:hypothetical protein